jgi:hypothetical protein
MTPSQKMKVMQRELRSLRGALQRTISVIERDRKHRDRNGFMVATRLGRLVLDGTPVSAAAAHLFICQWQRSGKEVRAALKEYYAAFARSRT